jgi:phosphatidylglycerophosphate synthase
MSVYAKLKEQKKTSADDDYFVYYTYRKLSTYFSWISIKLGFSANFVTFLSMLADFLVIYYMYAGNWILAAILVHLAPILDCSDGEVARYHIKNFKKTGYIKHYGGYLDEILGTIGFSLVIFFAGYLMGHFWIGFFAMFGLLMIIITSLTAQNLFKSKKEIAKNFEKKLFGNLKGRIGFGFGIQRLIISLAVFFYSHNILLFFAILANAFWIMKFWLYRKL